MPFFQCIRVSGIVLMVIMLCGGVAASDADLRSAQAWVDKGMLQREAGVPGAEESFTKARELLDGFIGVRTDEDRDLAAAYVMRGRCQNLLGNNEEAIGDLDRAIKLTEDNGGIYYIRSVIHGFMGEERSSRADLKTAARKGFEKAQDELSSDGVRW